jgi:ABC-type sugar transport system permease subunit
MIYAIQVFEYPFIITEGGPGVQTETVNFYLYRRLFMMNDVGMASAGSWFFLIVVIAISQVIIINIMRSEKWRGE